MNPYYEEENIKIYNGDALTILKELPDESIDLVVTSPPYNKGYYDKHIPHKSDVWRQRNIIYDDFKDNLEPQDYIKQQVSILKELIRIIKTRGSIFYNIKSIIANHKLIYPIFVFDFNVRQQIIWDRKSSPQLAPIRFYPTTEYIFWITKTNIQPYFNRKLAIFDKEVWTINPENNTKHPTQFPELLPYNCIITTTEKGGIILDPFAGSGTTGVVAKKLDRKFIGIELSQKYVDEIMIPRLQNTQCLMF